MKKRKLWFAGYVCLSNWLEVVFFFIRGRGGGGGGNKKDFCNCDLKKKKKERKESFDLWIMFACLFFFIGGGGGRGVGAWGWIFESLTKAGDPPKTTELPHFLVVKDIAFSLVPLTRHPCHE